MLSISEQIEAYRLGTAQPGNVVSEVLKDIGRSPLNAYVATRDTEAMAEAAAADRQFGSSTPNRALEGVTVALKDLIDLAGMATTMGAEHYKGNQAKQDAPVVVRLRDAGAIVTGKTNTHQFAYGSTGDRSCFGPVKNPRDLTRMSGGSSSGSAAAVAAGLCHAAIGTDTSASVRIPAALCGVVGMKPTYELVPRDGVFTLSATLDHIGPLTANVSDNARLLEVMASRPAGTYSNGIGRAIHGLKVGIVSGFYDDFICASVRSAMGDALAGLREAGAAVTEHCIPEIWDIYQAQQAVLKYEALQQHIDGLEKNMPYDPEVRDRLLAGAAVSRGEYLRAMEKQPWARQAFDRLLDDVDVILTPTCGILAPTIGERQTSVNGYVFPTPWLLTRLTAPTNFSGHPSISVPFHTEESLPIGLQVIARHGQESMCYCVAGTIETCAFNKKLR